MTADAERVVASMWEAKASPGRVDQLVDWAFDAALPVARAASGLLRAEVFRAADGRVVVITWWRGVPAELPGPPPELVARPAHVWPFEQVRR